jgi:hypothetical protein
MSWGGLDVLEDCWKSPGNVLEKIWIIPRVVPEKYWRVYLDVL